jgi:CubicO group peptidase (beta-lactamase class C family)
VTEPDLTGARAAIDARVARTAEREHVPGIAWGVMLDGELAMSGGAGTLVVGTDEPPSASSVFRIASMTKSFTAAAVLSLRDEGRLRLDDRAGDLAPELAAVRPPTSDSPALTVRHLLSMASGLATDDAWGDRVLDIDAAGLDAFVASGPGFAVPPGTAFEYSNLGYALLGRIVERVTGAPVQRLVTDRFLGPLGLTGTTWDPPTDAAWARPYAWLDGAWREEIAPLGDGGLAPMGGLWSTIDDLARWMAFYDDAFPPRDDPDDGPLARASRREQQQAHRAYPSEFRPAAGEGLDAVPARLDAGGYGYGLLTTHDLRFGYITGHAGGLPGYGSHMRWLPGRRVGAAALGNVTYAPMYALTRTLIEILDDHGLVPAPPAPSAAALQPAAERLVALLGAWDGAAAGTLFAENVLLDLDEEHRRAAAERLRAEHGLLRVKVVTAETARRGRMTVVGEDGHEFHVDFQLSPHAVPLVQWYEIVTP